MKKAAWENWLNVLLGAWLFAAPFWIRFPNLTLNASITASWNYWIVGIVVLLSAALALQDLQPWEEWTNLLAGIWMFLSPWVFSYQDEPHHVMNSIITGFLIAVLSGVALPVAQRLQQQRH